MSAAIRFLIVLAVLASIPLQAQVFGLLPEWTAHQAASLGFLFFAVVMIILIVIGVISLRSQR